MESNKDQLIQEMASDMNYATVKHDLWPDDAKEIARVLVILGYCKIPEGSVVLSKEEYEKYKKQDLFMKDYTIVEVLEKECDKTRKDTAKEFADIVYKTLTNERVWKAKHTWWLQNGECFELKDLLKQILKQQFNVGSERGKPIENKEMLQCCKDCSYQCKQYDNLTEPCGCDIADINYFNKVFKLYDDNKEEV